MVYVFALCFLTSTFALPLALIKPRWVFFWRQEEPSRTQAAAYCLGVGFVSLFGMLVTVPETKASAPRAAERAQSSVEPAPLPQNTVTAPAPAPVAAPPPPSPPQPEFAAFGDGTHVVGSEIQPGTYRTRRGREGCYFARLRGFSGTLDEIVSNENTDAPAVVTISRSDKGFESNGCGLWTADLSAITASRTSFEDGEYIVGTDIVPGTYKSSGEEGCYYARLRGFGHDLRDVIANNSTDGPAVVTISPRDKGFSATRCGTWTKVR